MMRKILFCMAVLMLSCGEPTEKFELPSDLSAVEKSGVGGANNDFKVPLPPGYRWEVTQSWAEHCEACDERYWDPSDPYCGGVSASHTGNCCLHSWDFNLPGSADRGKPVLASANGTLVERGYNSGWGYYVLINHGNNICSRYGHLVEGSHSHLSSGQEICQGLVIGEIGNSGASAGEHLHFQFEECDSGNTLPMGFTDGNGIPICTRFDDVNDQFGNYNFLKLTNEVKYDCGEQSHAPPEVANWNPPNGGWLKWSCGAIPGCPLKPNCGNGFWHRFNDDAELSPEIREAAAYLYSECVIEGKVDGSLDAYTWVTRAEALKIALELFGLMKECVSKENLSSFQDVSPSDWFYEYVNCGLYYGLLEKKKFNFYPNDVVNFSEAAKIFALAGQKAGVIFLQSPLVGHFPNIPRDHWAFTYAETIYYYGGAVDRNAADNSWMSRGDVVKMAASLSPCFCHNIDCELGCLCDQESFSCRDFDNNDPGIGGGDEPEVELPPGVSFDEEEVADVTESEVEPEVMAEVEDVVVEDDGPTMTPEPEPIAEPDAGVVAAETEEGDSPSEEPAATDWVCVEDTPEVPVGFKVRIEGKGACFEAYAGGGGAQDYFSAHVPSGGVGKINFSCLNLPVVMKVHADGEPVTVSSDANLYPPFASWMGYDGPFDFTPAIGPGVISNEVVIPAGGDLMFTFPAQIVEEVDVSDPNPVGNCCEEATCEETGFECGFLDTGCGYARGCGPCPAGKKCEAHKCVVDPCSFCPNTECVDGKCLVGPWQCEPEVGFGIWINSPGGVYQVLRSGGETAGVLGPEKSLPNGGVDLQFSCDEMPVAILVKGGTTHLNMVPAPANSEGNPFFSFWLPWSGEVDLEPSLNPIGNIDSFDSYEPGESWSPILIVVPSL